MKRIYFFGDGDASMRKLLGGKAAGLCEMAKLGLPVPTGFVATTEVCKEFYANGEKLPEGFLDDVKRSMKLIEEKMGRAFGDPQNPLLVSVRSGAAISMPGMMDTVLNLGLNDETVLGLTKQSGDARFAYDAYRRFVQLFGKVVLGVKDELFAKTFEEAKIEKNVKYDYELDAETLRRIVKEFKSIIRSETGEPFPSDPYKQLENAIVAVFRSWNGKRCVDYRREFKISSDIADGTAVTVMAMVFGNTGNDSATGVVFTRDPATGVKALYGDYLVNAQGEDVVAGVRTPKPINEMKNEIPPAYAELEKIGVILESHFKEPQDLEFTVERGKMYMLQTRNAKMNATAMVKTSVDMIREGLITVEQGLNRISPEQLEQLLHRRIDPKAKISPVAIGIPASPGAASGAIVLDADEAERRGKSGMKVILVREETKPEDIHGFFSSEGVLTSRGGKTSHAAVVARGMGKPCVCGCVDVKIDMQNRKVSIATFEAKEGNVITVDGTTGSVYLGEIPTVEPEPTSELIELLSHADKIRRLGVRANADTPVGAEVARKFGGEGIGLCRTERMFNAVDRLHLVVGMIMSDRYEDRCIFLDKLQPLQKEDFKRILKAMSGYPVTIRLLDPPLHEFLPKIEDLQMEIMSARNVDPKKMEEKKATLEKARELSEINPMLGHRGVRVGVTYPEIYEMQIKAIFEATVELLKEGIDARPQIMIPQVAMKEELATVKRIFSKVKAEVEKQHGINIPIKFGTMIEVVRACLTADRVAELVDFFSFGTNDLTQGTFSFSREDAENKFLPAYMESGLIETNPFQSIDVDGVGRLMRMAVELGRSTNGMLEVGICGEHGGDPSSIEFCHQIGLNYVSCSPYRIPIARLAASQAATKEKFKRSRGLG